ncbi:MAG: hypothetical protein ACLFWL_16830, partial [Candidatus Brocadiia bacterium]
TYTQQVYPALTGHTFDQSESGFGILFYFLHNHPPPAVSSPPVALAGRTTKHIQYQLQTNPSVLIVYPVRQVY